MPRMVALLRGVNVGGNKRIAMADLRAVLERLGYTAVGTVLQSGNAVFTCTAKAARTAAADIEDALVRDLGLSCAVVVRSQAEIDDVLSTSPFAGTDGARHIVAFLEPAPSQEAARSIAAIDVPPDRIELIGRQAYLWCPEGFSRSRLLDVKWERLLGGTITARNWNTVNKIAALMRS